MKILTALIAIAAAGLAVITIMLTNSNHELREKVKTLETVTREAPGQVAQASRQIEDLKEENARLRHEAGNVFLDLANAQAASNQVKIAEMNRPKTARGANGEGGSPNPAGFIQEMMKDPDMRKSMQAQQKMAMDMLYSSFFKDLGLPGKDLDKLKDLMAEKQMAMIDSAGALKPGGMTPEDQKKMTDLQKEVDAKIKEMIGDDGFAKYEDYNKTVGERMMMNQFVTSNDITPDTQNQLLNIIKEEKARTPGYPGDAASQAVEGMNAMQSEEGQAKLIARQDEIDSRVLARAASVLTPEQLEKFTAFQKTQHDMVVAQMKMAAKMLQSAPAK